MTNGGDRYGRLVVQSVYVSPTRHTRALCRCDCGALVDVRADALRRGKTRSCGCLKRETPMPSRRRHGMTGTPTHSSWSSMIARCDNPLEPGYGASGVTVHPRWRSFESFLDDMGERPHGTTLDRIDSFGHYEPGNCRWATPTVQGRNTRRVRLSEVAAMCIRALRTRGVTQRKLAAAFGVSRSAVRNVVNGHTWR